MMPSSSRQKKSSVPAGHTPVGSDSILRSRFSDQSLEATGKKTWSRLGGKKNDAAPKEPSSLVPIINVSSSLPATDNNNNNIADELDYITVLNNSDAPSTPNDALSLRHDKASRILGIRHRRSMEPIPASARNSIVSTRSLRDIRDIPSITHTPNLPLTSLYVVSGLPKSPHTWTLADPDSVMGLHHSEGAVSRWWRPEVLGSTVSPGAGGGKKKRRGKEEIMKGAGALSKQEVGKMLSKALKVRYSLFPLPALN
jgi:EEF1A N-terminal glycine/lysine methyltransferase